MWRVSTEIEQGLTRKQRRAGDLMKKKKEVKRQKSVEK